MGRSPSSIYFATTLKLWLVRSHILSSLFSSSLVKAIRFANLREFPSVPSLTGSEVQPTRVLRCARNRRLKINPGPSVILR